MKITPYIMFQNQCREAIAFYEKALCAKIVSSQTFGEMPDGDHPVPEEAKNLIMHAAIELEGESLLFSDAFPGQDVPNQSNVTLALLTDSLEQTNALFCALKEGGRVTMELQETFWSKCFGMVMDKFGIQWQLNFSQEK